MTDHPEEDTAAMQPPHTAVGDPTHYLPRVPRIPFPSTPPAETQVDLINRLLDEQGHRQAEQQHGVSLERLFRRRRLPRPPLTVRDVAAAREARTERMAQHRDRHERHMNLLEAARGYLGIMCLTALFVLVVVLGFVAFGIIAGWFTWMPVHN